MKYSDLGVKPVINGWGTVTVMGGSTMPDEVSAAMVEASKSFVPVAELEEAAGKYVAKLLGVEAAFICCGAAAGMALAAAACMAGKDPYWRNHLPDSNGLKNEIVVHRVMRTYYDQGYRLAGAKVVEYGYPKRSEEWELEHAITEKTAAVGFICEHAHLGGLPLEKIVEIAHRRGVPVIVDAAAEIPPVENLWKFSKMGVDLTVFSGGKDIRGPQSSGLILGRKDLIEACAFHSCPNHSIGRSMKIGKEEIMGLVTALTLYLKQDFHKELEQWETQVADMIKILNAAKGITAWRVFPGEPGIQPTDIPRCFVSWTNEINQATANEIHDALLVSEPRIILGTSGNNMVINPQMLELGQERIVAEGIIRILQKK